MLPHGTNHFGLSTATSLKVTIFKAIKCRIEAALVPPLAGSKKILEQIMFVLTLNTDPSKGTSVHQKFLFITE